MLPSIKDYDIREIESIFTELNEPSYRSKQLFNWIYARNMGSFSEMTNFSKKLRKKLGSLYSLSVLELVGREISHIDGTEKFLFKTQDNEFIESVLIKSEGDDSGRITICISSQVGCRMGCQFCETAKIGFRRNLSTGEILDQINQIRRITGLRNNNVVFMGMGEPMLNYDNVMKAADIMNYSYGFHISTRKITISTCGIRPAIEKFIDEKRPYNLALSLNDTVSEKRMVNMPVEKTFPFKTIVEMLNKKFPVSRNRLTIGYVMRKDNIGDDDVKRLKKMFRYGRIKLNLIPINAGHHSFGIPSPKEIDIFVKKLEIMNIPVSIRKSMGQDISGACGQLSGEKYL